MYLNYTTHYFVNGKCEVFPIVSGVSHCKISCRDGKHCAVALFLKSVRWYGL